MLNLNKASFLKSALEYIRANPGCSKADVVLMHGHVPNRTYSYRNAAINRLIRVGLVENAPGSKNRYHLVVKEN